MKPLLIILDDWEGRIAASSCWDALNDLVEVKFLNESVAKANKSDLENASFILAIRERTVFTAKVFSKFPQLKLILQTGGHANHIDLQAAQQRGVAVALGRRVKAPLASVMELTFAMMLGVMHLVPVANKAVHSGHWPLLTGRTLSNRRLGILGMGRHGSRVAYVARTAFNMDVVAWDRSGNGAEKNDGVPRLPLEELLETSDVVSIHLRLSKESTGLLNKERLQRMKPGAILINTSRGPIVDEKSLAEVLTSGTLAGAGLDVFEHEPLEAGSPLRAMENVILTPHIGWTVEEVFEEFAQIACTQLIEYLDGRLSSSELLQTE